MSTGEVALVTAAAGLAVAVFAFVAAVVVEQAIDRVRWRRFVAEYGPEFDLGDHGGYWS